MSNYQIAEGIYLVCGAKRGAICDTKTGSVYSINETACKILLGEKCDADYWNKLVKLNLTAPRKEEIPPSFSNFNKKEEIDLEFIWFEILSDDCNERCVHCYAGSMPFSFQKGNFIEIFDNKELIPNSRKVTFQEWLILIEEGSKLGCKSCQFIGGEPFLYNEGNNQRVLDLAKHAREVGYEAVEIFTNGTLITPNKVQLIKDLELSIAVSLYSNDPDVHDSITRTPGSYKKSLSALEMLKEADVPTRVEIVVMRLNQYTIDKTIEFINNMGFENRHPDVLRPKGRGDDPSLLPNPEIFAKYGLVTEPVFYADELFFKRSQNGHNCLAGKVAITDIGNVLPCIFSRNQIAGNIISAGSLKRVIQDELIQSIWHTTKENVLVCKDCEYRFVCLDCRPISEAVAGDYGDYLTSPYPRCTYDPYKGEWGGGFWRLDEIGNLFYDESLAAEITKLKN